MKEVEVKAKLRNKDKVVKKLQDLGCDLSEEIIQTDKVFAPNDVTNLPTGRNLPFLRIRESKDKYLLTLKIPQSNSLDKYEQETYVTDPAALENIILRIGFKLMVTIRKYRRKCTYNSWEICVDKVEGLGDFVEVEQLSEDGDSEKIQSELFNFLKTLGIEDADREHFGYDVLIWQKQNK